MQRNGSAILRAIVVVLVVVAFVGIGGVIFSYKQIPEGHVGVEKQWGDVTGTQISPGPNWIVPVQDSIQKVEVRPRTYGSTVDVTTLNGTTFNVSYVVRYHVVDDNASRFVTEWNTIGQAQNRLIDPTVEDRMRREGSGIASSVIYTQGGRDRLAEAAQSRLVGAFSDEAMVLEAVQITDVGIPEQYQGALNEKEIAKQQVQQEQYGIQEAEARAEQERVRAEADADVIRIKGEALRDNPIVLRQRYIDSINDTDKVIIGGSPTGDTTGATNTTDGVIIDASDSDGGA